MGNGIAIPINMVCNTRMSSDWIWIGVFLLTVIDVVHGRDPKRTVYMDQIANCKTVLYDGRLSEGDRYSVKSDTHIQPDLSFWDKRKHVPYCAIGFNYGDRLAAVKIDYWTCHKHNGSWDSAMEAHLAVYGNCRGSDTNLLAWYNCSNPSPIPVVYSPTACVSLIFDRGPNPSISFELAIIARHVLFPAYKIAAIIVSTFVILMLIVKVLCVVTGYENRLPNIQIIDPEEYKQILTDVSPGDPIIQVQQIPEIGASQSMSQHRGTLVAANPLTVNESADEHDERPNRKLRKSSDQLIQTHRTLTVTRSTGSTRSSHGSVSEANSEVEYDYLDLQSAPRLKRYPSSKAPSIFRHK